MENGEIITLSPLLEQQIRDTIRRVRAWGDPRPQQPTPAFQFHGQGFKNTDSSTTPPFGICIIKSFELNWGEGGGAYHKFLIERASATFPKAWALNGSTEVENGSFGAFQTCEKGIYKVAYDPADGTPALGEAWGPAPGKWIAKKGYPGLKVLGVWNESTTDNYNVKNVLLAVREEVSRIRCQATADIALGDTGTMNLVVNGAETTVEITGVKAEYFPVKDDGRYLVEFIQGTPSAIQGVHTEVTNLTDFRVDSLKLQKKTRDQFVIVDGAETDWTDIHTGVDCEEE